MKRKKKHAPASAPARSEKVRLQYHAPKAKRVCMAGTFNNWQPDAAPLQQQADGLWSIELPLRPGTYEYLFVVDGCWRPDPNATGTTPNPFGALNSVLRVSPKA